MKSMQLAAGILILLVASASTTFDDYNAVVQVNFTQSATGRNTITDNRFIGGPTASLEGGGALDGQSFPVTNFGTSSGATSYQAQSAAGKLRVSVSGNFSAQTNPIFAP